MTPYHSRRSTVYARHGMVASSEPLASAAGLKILQDGGNAADAAVGVAAALNVTEPCMTGIGGDMFVLYYDAATRAVTALNGSGHAPAALTIDKVRADGLAGPDDVMNDMFHPHTVTVPGAAAGWCDFLARHGSMPMGHALAPAIALAEEGFPVAPMTAVGWARGVERQRLATRGRDMTIDGRAPRVGEIFKNPNLARTFRALAEGGAEAFYTGRIARAVVDVLQGNGGVMEMSDLATHASTWDTPISTTYRGVRVWECPPNGQGIAGLIALNIYEQLIGDSRPHGVERLHLIVEALRLAFADARWYVADPARVHVPIDGLLDKGYAATRAKLVDRKHATLTHTHGMPFASSGTVYFCVVDGKGNAASFIDSNYMGFGAGWMGEGCGFTLQNRGHNFSLNPNHPNALAPGKRPYHTIIPGMLTHAASGDLMGPFGVMGGFMQPQGHMQVVLNLIDEGMDPQAALDAARVCLEPGEASAPVAVEDGVPDADLAALLAMGHRGAYRVSGDARGLFGRGQIILRDPVSGVLAGGSDPRADGCAIGW